MDNDIVLEESIIEIGNEVIDTEDICEEESLEEFDSVENTDFQQENMQGASKTIVDFDIDYEKDILPAADASFDEEDDELIVEEMIAVTEPIISGEGFIEEETVEEEEFANFSNVDYSQGYRRPAYQSPYLKTDNLGDKKESSSNINSFFKRKIR